MLGLIPLIAMLAQVPQGQIAFLQDDQGHSRHVSVVDLGSGKVSALGRGPWDDAPVWSPDGKQVAFGSASPDGVGMDLQVVDADGGHLRLLAIQEKAASPPAWSPNGKYLAYVAGVGTKRRIHVYELATDRDTEWGQSKVAMIGVVWRTDLALVAVGKMELHGAQTTDLFSVEEEESAVLVPTRGGGEYIEWNPAIQPRKGVLAFESNDGGDREIFVDMPGRGVIDVSNHRAADWNPVWSPDGKWIAFESFRSGRRGIYKVSPQQSVVSSIAVDAASDAWSATWSPDGEWVCFVSTRSGAPGLYICTAAGGNVHPVPGGENGLAPAWQPVVKK